MSLTPVNEIFDNMNDSKRLDWLQKQLDKASYTGKCIFRWSTRGRGWRLHETSDEVSSLCGADPVDNVREAIDDAMQREIDEGNNRGVADSGETKDSGASA